MFDIVLQNDSTEGPREFVCCKQKQDLQMLNQNVFKRFILFQDNNKRNLYTFGCEFGKNKRKVAVEVGELVVLFKFLSTIQENIVSPKDKSNE